MSPNEFHLRAALREGEGEAPDTDAIIGAALRLKRERHDRRVRLGGMAAAVLLVAGLGGGVALANHSDHSGRPAARAQAAKGLAPHSLFGAPRSTSTTSLGGTSRSGGTSPSGATAGTGGGNAQSQHGSVPALPRSLPNSVCPRSPVHYELPGGTGSSQFGASGALFSAPVTRLVICDYPLSGMPSSRELTGTAAAATAGRIEESKDPGSTLSCLTSAHATLLPFDAHGAEAPLELIGACNQLRVTNGTAVRYVPITTLLPEFGKPTVEPGKVSGTPTR